MWSSKSSEISRTERAKNEVLHRVKYESDILHTIKRGQANWIGHEATL